MMDSPIQNRIGCVFIPVSDMTRARRWYERLLGLSPSTTSHADQIVDLPMLGETQLILDSHQPVVNSSQPLLFFWTDDLRTTAEFLQQIAVEIVRPIEDIGSVSTLVIKDPDHNLLMICQRNPDTTDIATK
jgi:predicted enzyme related to lactoylglutathione lyase